MHGLAAGKWAEFKRLRRFVADWCQGENEGRLAYQALLSFFLARLHKHAAHTHTHTAG